MRQAARVDSNQMIIVDALRRAGCSVLILSRVGQGCPDLLVGVASLTSGLAGQNVLLEVKTPKGELTPDEERFLNSWLGPVEIVTTPEQALEAVRNERSR